MGAGTSRGHGDARDAREGCEGSRCVCVGVGGRACHWSSPDAYTNDGWGVRWEETTKLLVGDSADRHQKQQDKSRASICS